MPAVKPDVNPPRPNRQRTRSRRTREKIVHAALERFSADGYVATTLEAIAAQAGVAVQTVKFVFHTKAELLLEVIASAATDDQARPTLEQPWFLEATGAANGHRALALIVEFGTAIYERLAPLVAAIAAAATLDEEVAAQRTKTLAARRAGMARVIQALHRSGELTSDLDIDRATDVMFVLQSPENLHAFTATCGWPVHHYKAWEYKTLCTALLSRTSRAARLQSTNDLSYGAFVQ